MNPLTMLKITLQITLIILIWGVGELINRLVLPVLPGSVIGMVILFLLLYFKVIKVKHIKEVSDFVIKNLAFFFVHATVGIISSYGIIKDDILSILVLIIISTAIVIAATATVVQRISKNSECEK